MYILEHTHTAHIIMHTQTQHTLYSYIDIVNTMMKPYIKSIARCILMHTRIIKIMILDFKME